MKRYGLVIALVGLLAALPGTAKADSACASIDQFAGLEIEVCFTVADAGGGNFTLTVDSINGVNTVKAINSIGWDKSDASLISGPAGENWSNVQVDQNIDGFTPNDWAMQASGTGNLQNGGVGAQWTFSGDPGLDIVFHVQYNDACSTWVSNTRPNPGNAVLNDPATCGNTEVPEPATLTLLGTGLVGIAGAVRRRMAKKKA